MPAYISSWIKCTAMGLLLLAFIAFAYLTPVEVNQGQDFDGHSQNQSYSEGVTSGK